MGRRLARSGCPVYLLRRHARPLPTGIDESFAWPPHRRVSAPARTRVRAITVSSYFGATAEGQRKGPLGGAGPWSEEREAVEEAYGRDGTLHLSLEEFARTRSGRWHAEERWREGGMTSRDRIARRATAAGRRDVEEFVALYRKFRSFSRTNLLALFPGFRPSRSFAREFPESVQCGPIWPWPSGSRHRRDRPGRTRHVVWYAGPSSSGRIAGRVVDGLVNARVPVRLTVRSSRPIGVESRGRTHVEIVRSVSTARWAALWRRADLVIVSGSRTLLEAIDRGAPFLYFNGVLGTGPRTRRHRPEKISSLLDSLQAVRGPRSIRRDLSDFARGRRISAIVRAAMMDRRWRAWSPRRGDPSVYPPGFRDAGQLAVAVTRRFATEKGDAPTLVRSLRAASRGVEVAVGRSKA